MIHECHHLKNYFNLLKMSLDTYIMMKTMMKSSLFPEVSCRFDCVEQINSNVRAPMNKIND